MEAWEWSGILRDSPSLLTEVRARLAARFMKTTNCTARVDADVDMVIEALTSIRGNTPHIEHPDPLRIRREPDATVLPTIDAMVRAAKQSTVTLREQFEREAALAAMPVLLAADLSRENHPLGHGWVAEQAAKTAQALTERLFGPRL